MPENSIPLQVALEAVEALRVAANINTPETERVAVVRQCRLAYMSLSSYTEQIARSVAVTVEG